MTGAADDGGPRRGETVKTWGAEESWEAGGGHDAPVQRCIHDHCCIVFFFFFGDDGGVTYMT